MHQSNLNNVMNYQTACLQSYEQVREQSKGVSRSRVRVGKRLLGFLDEQVAYWSCA